jgi:dephospho-CoA kinase
MASQATDEARRAVADVVLDNSGTLVDLHAHVDALWADLVARQAASA